MLEEYVEHGGPVVRDGKRVIFGINRHRAWQIVSEHAEEAGLPKLINAETGRVLNDMRFVSSLLNNASTYEIYIFSLT